MRRAQPRPAKRSTDYLSVGLPSDDVPTTLNRRSRASTFDALHNPFGPDEQDPEVPSDEEDEEMEEMEVDLASWGLDALMTKNKEKGKEKAKDKSARKGKARTRSETFAALRAGERISEFGEQPGDNTHPRAMSLGNWGEFGLGGAFLEAESSVKGPEARPHSLASPDDLLKMMPQRPLQKRRASDHALIEKLPHHPPLHSVPFPQSTTTPRPDDSSGARPMSRYALPSQILANLAQDGSHSHKSQNAPSDGLGDEGGLLPRHSRTMSASSRDLLADENNPFAVRPPSPSRMSRFDPKMAARARTTSMASLGTQQMLDDAASEMSERPRGRPYSKWDLMRPKVLVMPSPLQDQLPKGPDQPVGRDGFVISNELPLPPGARGMKRASTSLNVLQPSGTMNIPNPGSAFTPNPRATMSLSQLAFRNTLMVDGRRDSTYADLDAMLPRATEDGQQAEFPDIEEPTAPIPVAVDEPEDPAGKPKRPAGKLYGRSLIDNLEARKQDMRNKQRVYRGDDRPQMMSRTPLNRSSTLIDPATLPQRPVSKHMDSFNSSQSMPALNRRSSGPLLHFDANGNELPGPASSNNLEKVPKSRSVFGVDTIWERELAKLREMEAKENAGTDNIQAQPNDLNKGTAQPPSSARSPAPPEPTSPKRPATTVLPVLPKIQKVTTTRKLPAGNADSDSESESDNDNPAPANVQEAAGWGSSDDEAPRRVTAALSPARSQGRGPVPHMVVPDSDSEEDVPLVATIGRAAQRIARSAVDSDSDEDKPLTAIMHKKPSRGFLDIDFDLSTSTKAPINAEKKADDSEEDEQPLGLRASTILGANPRPTGGEDEDELPLAMHPEQQRRTQYQMLAQQQQQQQMMMMMQAQQAQMQMQMMTGSMYMGGPPSAMGSGFFNPAMAPGMMTMPPPQSGSPPPMHDAANYGRVDRWRHDVAVEGDKS